MDKYLLEILKNVNTIIIPGLGALTITNHDTGEIMFMSYLKHDDGKLTQYIVENEGFEELEAKNLIAKYVREIQLTLDKGESYDMFQFGSFVKKDDEIDFINWEGTPSHDTKNEVQPNTELEQEIIPVSDDSEVNTTENDSTDIEIETTIANDQAEEVIEEQSNESSKLEEESQKIILPLEEEPVKELNILEKEERAATAAKLDKLKAEKNKPVTKRKRGLAFWMLMTLLVLIVAGGTYFGLNYNELKQHVPFLADKKEASYKEKKEKEENPSEMDQEMETSPEEETEVAPEPIEEEPVVEESQVEELPQVSTSSDLPFHIIVGAFSSEANANRLGDKLRSEGHQVKVGPGRGMNLVSIKSFATRAEAQANLSEFQSIAPNGWIFEWR